jgi:DNA-binding NarL/FixJ family response regulator
LISSLKIRVLCVDDHPLIRDGIAFALQAEKDMELVGEATNGLEAIDKFRALQPDITLMDLQMPVLNGVEAMTRIREEFPASRFIVLTTFAGDALAVQAFRAGASGYLLKKMLRSEMINTIREVHRGLRRVPAEIAQSLAERVPDNDLSAREIEILKFVAVGDSNKLIAGRLAISEDTVKWHMKNIMLKLGARDRTHAVLIATQRGFLGT